MTSYQKYSSVHLKLSCTYLFWLEKIAKLYEHIFLNHCKNLFSFKRTVSGKRKQKKMRLMRECIALQALIFFQENSCWNMKTKKCGSMRECIVLQELIFFQEKSCWKRKTKKCHSMTECAVLFQTLLREFLSRNYNLKHDSGFSADSGHKIP